MRTESAARYRRERDFLLSLILCASGVGFAYWIYPRFLPDPPKPVAYGDNRYASELRDREGRKIFPGSRPLQYVLSPYTFYRLAPDQHLPWLNTDARGNRVTPGSGGARPVSVLLGGSTAMGYGAGSDGETLSAQLQKLRPRESWINAGVAGFGSGNELAQMIHYADEFRPRVYVDLSGWNDFDADPRRSHVLPFGFSDYWMLQVEERLSNYYREKHAPGEPDEPLKLPFARKVSWRGMQAKVLATFQSNILKMRDFARARGARYVLALQPKPPENTRSEAFAEFSAKVAQFCRDSSVECLDLNAVESVRSAGPAFYAEGVHLTAAGYAEVAKILSDWLDQAK